MSKIPDPHTKRGGYTAHRFTAYCEDRPIPIIYALVNDEKGETHLNWWIDNPDDENSELTQFWDNMTELQSVIIQSQAAADAMT